ncbi:BrnA antitoxin family protein [Methylobacterium sp. J-088]|nr:BrnA antitoxin family protein [Methylobacterium sp. J-088]
MPASRTNTSGSFADGLGATDLAKVDAHAITAEEYDAIPELTDAMMARAVSGDGLNLLKRGRGRPRIDQPKRQITLRLDADVIEAMRAGGPGWQVRANEALKKRFQR